MNTPNEPLPADVVDDLLSAELDDAFDAAAREHGLTPSTARAGLEATPGAQERRAAFAAARDELAVAPLDDVSRDQLLEHARIASSHDEVGARRADRSRARGVALIAAAAAAIVLVVGIGASIVAIRDRDNERDAASTARESSESFERDDTSPSSGERAADSGAGSDASANANTYTYDFGTIADTSSLRSSVEDAMRTRLQALSGARAPDANQLNPVPSAPAGESATDRFVSSASAACVATEGARAGSDAPLLARGPVVYAGTPAEVLVLGDGEDAVAVVVNDIDGGCEVLATQVVDPQP